MITYNFTGHVVRSDGEDCQVPVEVGLNYDAGHDPLAVAMTLTQEGVDYTVTWTFARDLLVRGSSTPFQVGGGDVKFRATEDHLFVCLRNRNADAHADLAFPIRIVREFIAATTEEADQCLDTLSLAVDAFIAEVLG